MHGPMFPSDSLSPPTLDRKSTINMLAAAATPRTPKVVTDEHLNLLHRQAEQEDPTALNPLDVNVRTQDGDTLVFRLLDQPGLLERVLQRGAPVDVKMEEGFYRHMTALFQAIVRAPASTCELLLRYGADANLRVSSGSSDSMSWETTRGAYNIHNFTPLCFALVAREHPCPHLATLLEHGADLRAIVKNPDHPIGKTCLHVAAQQGHLNCIELLLQYGADINQLDESENSALLDAAQHETTSEVFLRLLDHANKTHGPCTRWSDQVFEALLRVQAPSVVTKYLDSFMAESERISNHKRYRCFSFRQMHQIYGPPWNPIDKSPLRVCLNHLERRQELQIVLTHPTLDYVFQAKFAAFAFWVWTLELLLFVTLNVTAFIAFLADDQHQAINCRWVAVLLAGVFLLLEAKDCLESPGQYFSSFTNKLNLAAYGGVIVVSVVTWSTPTGHEYSNTKAVVLVLLTFCAVEYLRILRLTGLLITMMTEMLGDVAKFLMLYMLFQVAFSGAFFAIFRDNRDTQTRFRTYSRAFVSTFFMLFGDFDAEMFLNGTGTTGVVADVLVILYLTGAVVILLNILIAMMSTSYQQVADSAKSMQCIARAELAMRNEALLPHCLRVTLYDAMIPDNQPWYKYAAHQAAEEARAALKAKQTLNAFEDVMKHMEPVETTVLSESGTKLPANEETGGADCFYGDDNLLRPLGTVVFWTETETNKERNEELSDVVNEKVARMQHQLDKLQTGLDEQHRFQKEVHVQLQTIGTLVDQLVAADKKRSGTCVRREAHRGKEESKK